jgi:formamidopyrimidine-DNA glycosylase
VVTKAGADPGDGQACARCRQPIIHGKLDSRTPSYFCAQCQT